MTTQEKQALYRAVRQEIHATGNKASDVYKKYSLSPKAYTQWAYRQLMSSAIYRGYDAVLPVVDRISDYIRRADNCRADETRLFIIECNGEKARIADPEKTKMSYVWLFMTAEGYHPAYSYVVGPSRKYENASKFFSIPVRHRFLQSDDYGAYNGLENTDRIPCLVHTKRKFFEAMNSAGKTERRTESEKIVGMISMIHRADDIVLAQLADRKGTAGYYDLVKEQRLLIVKPLMDAFYAELDRISGRVPPLMRDLMSFGTIRFQSLLRTSLLNSPFMR